MDGGRAGGWGWEVGIEEEGREGGEGCEGREGGREGRR